MKYSTLLSLLCLFLISSLPLNAQRVKGQGGSITQELKLQEFSGIELAIPAKVTVTQGAEQKVVVTGQKNIIDLLKTDIRGGAWDISFDARSVQDYAPLTIEITVARLERVSVSGSGKVKTLSHFHTSENFDLSISGSGKANLDIEATNLRCSISGSGSAKLTGAAENLEISIAGSGDIEGYDLKTKTCSINTSGSGSAEVEVSESLSASIVGSGSVWYQGNPTVKTNTIGSGKVLARK